MKTWDAIIIGAGIIGLSLAIELRKYGLRVLIVEKGEPGREASWAAGGMLADFPLEMPSVLQELATASARMYPEFVHELEDESRLKIDLRDQGTLLLVNAAPATRRQSRRHLATAEKMPEARLHPPAGGDDPELLSIEQLKQLEPQLKPAIGGAFLKERSVDPRGLTTAAIAAARHRGIDFSSGDEVREIEISEGKACGVSTNKTRFSAAVVVNCAGAWSGHVGMVNVATAYVGTGAPPGVPNKPGSGLLGWLSVQAERSSPALALIPTRPVKGQMLCVAMPEKELVRHVIRAADVYLIPRSDGRLLIGATQEEAGFDKQTIPETIQKLRHTAIELVPKLADARILEAWAGLRPGTPDNLPILGATAIPSYFVATGHFRDGILLAPVTARVMAQVITGQSPEFDLKAFTAERFRS